MPSGAMQGGANPALSSALPPTKEIQ
jgi:hypothetical protein